MLGLSVT